MTPNKTIDYYNENAESFYQRTVGLDLIEIYEKFLKQVPDSCTILDVGCGSGRDTLYFLNNGYEVISIDASSEMVKLSSKLTNQNTSLLNIEDIAFKDQFEGIWACASLLHIDESKTTDVYHKLRDAMKMNGFCYASYKYGNGTEVREGRYYSHYDEDSFQKMFENIKGLEIVELWDTLDLKEDGNDEKWLNILLRRSD
jgi:SAM-dependent methyltransferase